MLVIGVILTYEQCLILRKYSVAVSCSRAEGPPYPSLRMQSLLSHRGVVDAYASDLNANLLNLFLSLPDPFWAGPRLRDSERLSSLLKGEDGRVSLGVIHTLSQGFPTSADPKTRHELSLSNLYVDTASFTCKIQSPQRTTNVEKQ